MKVIRLFLLYSLLHVILVVSASALDYTLLWTQTLDNETTGAQPQGWVELEAGDFTVTETPSATNKSFQLSSGLDDVSIERTFPFTMNSSDGCYLFEANVKQTSVDTVRFGFPIGPDESQIQIRTNNDGTFSYVNGSGVEVGTSPDIGSSWASLSVSVCGSAFNASINGVQWATCTSGCATNSLVWATTANLTNIAVRGHIGIHYFDEFKIYEGKTVGAPSTTAINCTFCVNDTTPDVAPYETMDTTPTFAVETDVDAWCRIGKTDLNYTGLGAARNCTSGAGTKSHICTLPIADALTEANSSVYLGCRSEENQESQNSTSGPLEVALTLLSIDEAAGDAAIIESIQNSSIATATIYTDQQVYVRDADNNQALGTFDVVAAFGNQRWAFNYVTANDPTSGFTNMFNISPVFYVLEVANKTADGLQYGVDQLITSTKT